VGVGGGGNDRGACTRAGASGRGGPGVPRIGAYTLEERKARIAAFHEKRKKRVWSKRVNYHCRQRLADGRVRVKGRFVKRTAE
jgi:hypothetical protein